MKLILTRHGETEENKKWIIQGHLPGTLSEEGIEQAKKLALRLKNEKIDHIYSSDLKRAADTAKEIAKYHPNIPIHFVKELRERDWGPNITGKYKKDIDWDNKPDGMESLKDIRKRAKALLDKVYDKHSNATVLFIAHGKINKIFFTIICNKSVECNNEFEKQKNTAVNIFCIKEDKNHVVHLMNCVKHLE